MGVLDFLGFGGRQATAPARNQGLMRPRLCEKVALPVGEDQVVRWRYLLAELRQRADQRRGFRGGRTIRRELPFRDVILKGPFDPEDVSALGLRGELESEFADTRADFHTLSIRAPTRDSQLFAFFGNGVFVPDDEDVQVADLELSWHDPFKPNFTANRIVTPVLDPASGGGRNRHAAWYAGQMGVAIGFHSDMAPSFVDGAPVGASAQGLPKFFLYIGRLDRFTPPVFEVHCDDRQIRGRAVCDNPLDWWLRDGEWQGLLIEVGNQSFRLWLRLTSRTGDIVFRNGAALGGAAKGRRRIVVRGILFPELPTMGWFDNLLPGRSPTRWSAEFDGQGRLRSQEILDLAHSVVAQWGTRFGIYQHQEARWVDRRSAITGQQDFALSRGARLVHRNFPGRSLVAQRGGDAWRTIYQRSWSLLQFADERPFGYFDLPARAHELIGSPEIGTPVRGDDPAEHDWKIGIDWLNRAAHVTISDKVFGLADYWCRHWATQISAADDGLDVEVTGVGAQNKQNYRIAPGARGPVGPLYIEYKID